MKLPTRSKLLGASAVLGLAITAAPVMADHEVQKVEHHHYHHYNQSHNTAAYGPQCPHQAQGYQAGPYRYAQSSPPQYQSNPGYGSGYGYSPRRSYAPTTGQAIGGALGGWAGSQIGSGSGNLAATALGAVLGYNLGGRW